jgi:hypothetical protein
MIILPAIALLFSAGAPTPAPSAPTPPARLAELVKKLGDKSYRAREDAARQLLLQGSAAVAVLKEGTRDLDPEVSERCRQLLIQGPALERKNKLAALVADPKAPPPKDLPGLERFLKATGDSKEARELYAEMASVHMHVLEAAEKNVKEAARYYSEFCTGAYARYLGAGQMTRRYTFDNLFASRAEITFFLFLSGDSRSRGQNIEGPNYAGILFNGDQITNAIDPKRGSESMRKIFLDWLEHEPMAHLQQQGFQLAAKAELKEALPIALRLLEKKDHNNNSNGKAQIMLSLPKLGGKEHIKVLEQYLDNSTEVTSVNFGDGRQLTVQMRDVAMGAQIQLAGEKTADYGYDTRYGGGANQPYPHYYGFADDKSRDDAHAKWKEWKSKNMKGASGPTPDAKSPDKKGPEKK